MKTAVKILVVGCAILGVALIAFLAQMWFYQERVGGQLRSELGFEHGSPYVRCGGITRREVFTIESVRSGGVFERAGFHNGDIVVGMSITEFYRVLQSKRGDDVMISVVDGGDGPALSERPVRQIRFRVPETAQRSNKVTGPNAGGPRQLSLRTPLTARVGQFYRSAAF
jgi:hypothetical protein